MMVVLSLPYQRKLCKVLFLEEQLRLTTSPHSLSCPSGQVGAALCNSRALPSSQNDASGKDRLPDRTHQHRESPQEPSKAQSSFICLCCFLFSISNLNCPEPWPPGSLTSLNSFLPQLKPSRALLLPGICNWFLHQAKSILGTHFLLVAQPQREHLPWQVTWSGFLKQRNPVEEDVPLPKPVLEGQRDSGGQLNGAWC